MNLKVLKIAGFDIAVEEWTTQEAAIQNAFGDFVPLSLTIHLAPNQHPYKLLDTLIHEIAHSIFWAYSINDEDKEEQICRVLSTALTQVLRDNPTLVQFIQETFEK